jgi:alkanesulfonate monooxygenase SsuD/methylene tetrahydromethanopterin reductase-like flavin-dependent oxidoreductase (luciferase family)
MRQVWTGDAAEYHGKVVDFPAVRSEPRPVNGSIPVHIGGLGENAMRRVAAYADGWCPVSLFSAEQMGRDYARIKEMAADNGRDGAAIEFSVFLGVRETTDVRAKTEKWAAAGASRIVLSIGEAEGPMAYVSYRFDLYTSAAVAGTLDRLAGRCF